MARRRRGARGRITINRHADDPRSAFSRFAAEDEQRSRENAKHKRERDAAVVKQKCALSARQQGRRPPDAEA